MKKDKKNQNKDNFKAPVIKIVHYFVDPEIPENERLEIIKQVEEAKKNRKRL